MINREQAKNVVDELSYALNDITLMLFEDNLPDETFDEVMNDIKNFYSQHGIIINFEEV